MTTKLLTRDQFREEVFARDNHACVVCGCRAIDAHHIMERRLFSDGGYYLDNGASVCELHHVACEETRISIRDIREACGIRQSVIPPHLYRDQEYDKWGNLVLANGQRLKGELFHDESVQKVLARGGVLDRFTDWVKYPRTHHLPWSPGITHDDRTLDSMAPFKGQRVIVTEKMDGENTTIYRDYLHARSIDGRTHPSRDWVKQFRGRFCADIPAGWRVCGENLYARHSIAYDDLESYFLGFAIWNERNVCLSWDETTEWMELLGIPMVPLLHDGIFDERLIRSLWRDDAWSRCEGYVLRLASPITYGDFRRHVGKFVRHDHVQTVKHWMQGRRLLPNGLR